MDDMEGGSLVRQVYSGGGDWWKAQRKTTNVLD